MLRVVAVLVAFALVTLPLMPAQWLAVVLKRPRQTIIGNVARENVARTPRRTSTAPRSIPSRPREGGS